MIHHLNYAYDSVYASGPLDTLRQMRTYTVPATSSSGCYEQQHTPDLLIQSFSDLNLTI